MQYQKTYPIPTEGGLSKPADWMYVGHVPKWEPDGPTLRFSELLKVIRVSRSKAYELARTDPTFPQGIPLFDTERSPRFWWTHEIGRASCRERGGQYGKISVVDGSLKKKKR